MARYDGRRRFNRKTARKPLKAMAKKARYKKSAGAQSRQIAKLARHVSTLKQTVKEDTSMKAIYQMSFESKVALKNLSSYCSHIIVPLTCGVNQIPDVPPAAPLGDQPINTLATASPYGPNLAWTPIFQPRDLHPAVGDEAIPPWIKLYNQRCKLRFWAHTVKQPTDITVSVLRARKHGPVANVKSIAKRLDGQFNLGPAPDLVNSHTYIAKNRDYTASNGLNFGQAASATGPPGLISPNLDGSTNIEWNRELWEVHYQKQFTLGCAFNPLTEPLMAPDHPDGSSGGPSYASEDKTAINPASMCPERNLGSEECRFTINYGGLKLSTVPPLDAGSINLDTMKVTDSRYQNIPSEHKYFLVISSSNPQVDASVFHPYMQFSSQISTRVPI